MTKRTRSMTLRKKTFERDNFTCQKCKLEDKEAKILEAHHVIPLYIGGSDSIDNLITLCSDCHRFAPDKNEDFNEYMKEEMEGTLTMLMKGWNNFRKENPSIFDKVGERL